MKSSRLSSPSSRGGVVAATTPGMGAEDVAELAAGVAGPGTELVGFPSMVASAASINFGISNNAHLRRRGERRFAGSGSMRAQVET